MSHFRKTGEHHFRAGLRRGDKGPGAPFAPVAAAEFDVVQIREAVDEPVICATVNLPVYVNDNRATVTGPMTGNLFGAIQRFVHKYDEADGHAQFPFDINPRISSWRQLIYFSDHLHQRSEFSSILV